MEGWLARRYNSELGLLPPIYEERDSPILGVSARMEITCENKRLLLLGCSLFARKIIGEFRKTFGKVGREEPSCMA